MRSLFIFSSILLIACNSKPNFEYTEVKYAGALKNMMHKGDLSAYADLDTFSTKHLFALGAIAQLKGEIQIFDGKSSSSLVKNNGVTIPSGTNQKASLLVWAYVAKWQEIKVPDSVGTKVELEHFIAACAETYGLPTDKPFPFLLEGEAKTINWHVINWPAGDTVHKHQKHVESGLNGKLENQEAAFLGFYSNAHHAIFTHHTTNMHIHFKTKSGKLAGHVDDLEVAEGMVLKLPLLE